MDEVNLGCTQSEAKVDNQAVPVQSRFVQKDQITTGGIEEKYQANEQDSSEKITAWSCDTKGHAEKCIERRCESEIFFPTSGNTVCRRSPDTS